MGAGPTVRIDATGPTSENYLTTVTWGSQRGEGRMRSISAALVLVDKLACVFYEIRRDADKGDVV